MAEQQPVVCVFLKLPLDQRLFFRIGELSLVFLQEFNNLDVALEASRDTHSYHQTMTILDELRKCAADACDSLMIAIVSAFRFAQHYHELLAALSEEMEDEVAPRIVNIVDTAYLNEQQIEETSKEMSQFGESITNAIRRVTDAIDDDTKNNSKGSVCDPDNIQVAMKLFKATVECGRLLGECRDYYKMLQNMKVGDSLNLPSDDEIILMRERWSAFLHGMKDFTYEYPQLARRIRNDPWISMPRAPDSQAGMRKDASAADSVNPSASPIPKTPFWQRFICRILPCLPNKLCC